MNTAKPADMRTAGPMLANLEGPSVHSAAQRWFRFVLLAALLVLLAAPLPFARASSYRGSQEFHAAIEMAGAVMAILAGTCFITRFYSLGNHFHLLVGLAFFANGVKDFVHGLLSLAECRQWMIMSAARFEQSIPATGASGRILMALLLILSVLLPPRMGKPGNPKRETFWASALVLVAAGLVTGAIFLVPLPRFVFPDQVISRPVDFASAGLFAIALALFLGMYQRTRDALVWGLALAVGINVVAQGIMGFSRQLGDACYDIAHVYKVLGYAVPVLSFAVFQTLTILEVKRLRVLVNSVEDYAIFMLDPQGRVVSWNVGAERIKGYDADEILGRHFSCFYTPEDRDAGRPEAELQKAVAEGRCESEGWHVRKNGSRLWTNAVITPVLDDAGILCGFAKITRDITRRKQADEELRLNEARLQALVQLTQMTGASLQEITDFALESAVALTNSTIGYLAFMNEDESVLTMHSWSKTAMAQCAIIDKPIVYQVVNTGLWGEAVRQRKPVVTNDYLSPNPLKRGHPEGHVPVLRHMNAPICDGERIVIVAGVGNKAAPYDDADVRQLTLLMQGMWQILQRKRAEESLAGYARQLEVANRELEAFSYSVSHDLRTPLRALDGFSLALIEDCGDRLEDSAKDYLNRIRAASQRMGTLIDDLLKLSRITRHELDRRTVDLSRLARAVEQELRGVEPARCVELIIEDGLIGVGDEHLLRVAIQQLLENAWKFTGKQPRARIEFSRTRCDGQTVYFVRDNGVGFDMTYADNLFGAFQRLHAAAEFPGTGIGLATVQRIVHRHGGRVWAEAALEKGATFYFTL